MQHHAVGHTDTAYCTGTPVAVFKPLDEEPLMPHNPRNNSLRLGSLGLSSTPLGSPPGSVKRGVQPGEGAVREVRPGLLLLWHELSCCSVCCLHCLGLTADLLMEGSAPA